MKVNVDEIFSTLKEMKEQDFFRTLSNAEIDFIEKCIEMAGEKVLQQMHGEEDE